ncbi:MAG TPA: hypothetical protein VFX70_11955 [Mycobacteriales bacterium]|nr:hypothetical protein [Mycobacteriales bacterium]
MSREIEWMLVRVGGVLFVYADGRYVGEIGRSLFARAGCRWWASTGWEAGRSRYPTRDAALASIQDSTGGRPSEVV